MEKSTKEPWNDEEIALLLHLLTTRDKDWRKDYKKLSVKFNQQKHNGECERTDRSIKNFCYKSRLSVMDKTGLQSMTVEKTRENLENYYKDIQHQKKEKKRSIGSTGVVIEKTTNSG